MQKAILETTGFILGIAIGFAIGYMLGIVHLAIEPGG